MKALERVSRAGTVYLWLLALREGLGLLVTLAAAVTTVIGVWAIIELARVMVP